MKGGTEPSAIPDIALPAKEAGAKQAIDGSDASSAQLKCISVDTGSDKEPPILRVKSIYDVRTVRTRWLLLGLASLVNMLPPFSNTLYIPALNAIRLDLHTTTTLTAASIAVYMFALGLGSLVWGPFADRFGRRWTMYVSSFFYLGFSVGCIFSHDIIVLIVLRALQGLTVSAFGVSSQAVVADVFPPHERGKAMGVAIIPVLFGPIVGPLVGGGLSQAFGWRSTFVAMGILGVIVLLAVFLFMEETHHYHVLKQVCSTQGHPAAAAILESATTPEPKFEPPYKPLMLLLDPLIWPHILASITLFGTLYACMIMLPYELAAPPYNLGQALIGVCNMSLGLGLLIAAPIGGVLADRASKKWSSNPAGRMLYGGPVAVVIFPTSAAVFGWALHFRLHLGILLAMSFVIGLGVALYSPATSALVSIAKQDHAAAASGAQYAAMFAVGGVFVIVTPIGMGTIGIGPLISILSGLCVLVLLNAIWWSISRVRRAAAAASSAESVEDGTAAGHRQLVADASRATDGLPHHRQQRSDQHRCACAAHGRVHRRDDASGGTEAEAEVEVQVEVEDKLLASAERLEHLEGALVDHASAFRDLQRGVERVAQLLAERGDEVRRLGDRVQQVEEGVAAAAAGAEAAAKAAAASAAASAAAAHPYPQPLAAGLPADLERHVERIEHALDEQSEMLRGEQRHMELVVERSFTPRDGALRELERRVERMEQALGEQAVALRGRRSDVERRLGEQAAVLKELLELVRGLGQ